MQENENKDTSEKPFAISVNTDMQLIPNASGFNQATFLQRAVIRTTETFRISAEGTSHVIGDRPYLSAFYYAPVPPGKAPLIVIGSFLYSLSQDHDNDGIKSWENLAQAWRGNNIKLPEYMDIHEETGELSINKKALGVHLVKQAGKYYARTLKPAVDVYNGIKFPLTLAFTAQTQDIRQDYIAHTPTYDTRYSASL